MEHYVYAGAAGWTAAAQGVPTDGFFRMRIGGSGEWERLTKGLPDNAEIRSIVVQPGAPQTVYAGTQDGPYRSDDGGATWRSLGLPGKNRVVWSILIHPKDPKVLYVGTEGTSIFRSRDGGATWRELSVPEPEGICHMGFPVRVVRLALDPSNPDELYAGLEVGGVVRSLDGGETWQGCNKGLLALAEQSHLKSRIGSDTDTEGMMDSHALAVSAAKPGTVFLANRMGLFRSPDRGGTWDEIGISKFSPLTYARDVKVAAHNASTLYAALSGAAVSDIGALWRSRDLGQTWQRFDHDVSIESTLMVVAASAAKPERVWCASRRGQVFGTEDGGKTWQTSKLPGGGQGVYALATG
jgi:photosystem II stability/assembly factor-like uncharacterized protein